MFGTSVLHVLDMVATALYLTTAFAPPEAAYSPGVWDRTHKQAMAPKGCKESEKNHKGS